MLIFVHSNGLCGKKTPAVGYIEAQRTVVMFFVNRYVQFCKILKKVIFLSSTSHATPHSGSAIKVQFLVLDSQSISKKSHRLAAKV